jgi:hypothetical protein
MRRTRSPNSTAPREKGGRRLRSLDRSAQEDATLDTSNNDQP